MLFFVHCRRAGAGLHVLKKPPIYTAPRPATFFDDRRPRDRLYTLCGYRVPVGNRHPNDIAVEIDGVQMPRVVPKSQWAVCGKCAKLVGDKDLMLMASCAREACAARRAGMLGYGGPREDASVGFWVLWVNLYPA